MKTLKLIALIEGEEVVVGRCHPGEARLLQKKGLAEWKDGKVVFKEAPTWAAKPNAPPKVAEADTIPLHHLPFTGLPQEEHDQIDPERIISDFFANKRPQAPTTVLDNAKVWCDQLAARKLAGHELACSDNPVARCLGFVDYTDNLCFELGLAAFKAAKDEDFISLGKPESVRELLRTLEGRHLLVGTDPLYVETANDPGEVPAEVWGELPPVSPQIDKPVPRLTPYPGWASFHWPEDQEIVVILDALGIPLGPPDTGHLLGFFRRKGERIVRIWPDTSCNRLAGTAFLDLACWDETIRAYRLAERSRRDSTFDARSRAEVYLRSGVTRPSWDSPSGPA